MSYQDTLRVTHVGACARKKCVNALLTRTTAAASICGRASDAINKKIIINILLGGVYLRGVFDGVATRQ